MKHWNTEMNAENDPELNTKGILGLPRVYSDTVSGILVVGLFGALVGSSFGGGLATLIGMTVALLFYGCIWVREARIYLQHKTSSVSNNHNK